MKVILVSCKHPLTWIRTSFVFWPSPALLFFLAVLTWITDMEPSVLQEPLSHPALSAFLPPPLYFRPELGRCEQWPPLQPVFDWQSVSLPRPAGMESCFAEVDWNGPGAEDRNNACLEHDSVTVKSLVSEESFMFWCPQMAKHVVAWLPYNDIAINTKIQQHFCWYSVINQKVLLQNDLFHLVQSCCKA